MTTTFQRTNTGPSASPTGRSARILVVDDSEIARAAICLILEAAGHEVHQLDSALGASWLLAQHDVEIVVLDLRMPAMSGAKFAEIVRANPRFNRVKLVLVTGESVAELRSEGARIGADAALMKAHLQDELLPTIERLLASGERTDGDRNRSRRVLVVDPSAGSCIRTVRVLEHAGYSVEARSQGKGTLGAVADFKPGFVFLSLELIDIPCLTLAELLRESRITSGARVILQPEREDPSFASVARGCGAVGVIPTSASPEELLERLKAIATRR